MTPGDFERLIRYHDAMVKHHAKLIECYRRERLKLLRARAAKTAKQTSDDILRKLSEQTSQQ